MNPKRQTGLDQALAALADPTRRRLVDLLRERPRPAGELAAEFDLSAPAISRHLRVLRKNGLVEGTLVERDARLRLYRLRRKPFAELHKWLSRMGALWTDQLSAFKAYAEGTKRR